MLLALGVVKVDVIDEGFSRSCWVCLHEGVEFIKLQYNLCFLEFMPFLKNLIDLLFLLLWNFEFPSSKLHLQIEVLPEQIQKPSFLDTGHKLLLRWCIGL